MQSFTKIQPFIGITKDECILIHQLKHQVLFTHCFITVFLLSLQYLKTASNYCTNFFSSYQRNTVNAFIKNSVLPAALFAIFLLQSCATVFRSSSPNELFISSEPDEAKVYIDGFPVGTTPVRTSLRPKKQYIVEIRKQGYHPHIEVVESKIVAGWLVLDLLGLVYILPPIIDAGTGAWYEPKDEMLFMELTPINDSASLQTNLSQLPNPAKNLKRALPVEEPIIALISAGYTFPSVYGSQYIIFLPTSVGIGLGYKIDSSFTLGVSLESSGTRKNVLYTSFSPNDSLVPLQIYPSITTVSFDTRYRFVKSALYGLVGIGGLAVEGGEEKRTFTNSGSIPAFSEFIAGCSFGLGIAPKGGGFFGEARYTIGLQKVSFAPYQPFSSNFFTLKFGYYFDGF